MSQLLSIVIPVLNEEENLDELYRRLSAAAPAWGLDWEVVFVDDGSTDRTLPILEDLNRKDARVKVVSFSRNFGHQTAVTAGLQHTSGDVVAVMDADLQDPPEELPRFLAKWREGYHVVYAIRRKRKENAIKRAAYFLFYRLLASLSSIPIPLDSGDFCVMDRAVVDVLNALPERNRFVRGLRTWVGYKQIGVEYERSARHAGEVKYTFRKLIRLAFDGLTNFSYRPLQLATTLGFFTAGVSLFAILYSLVVWAFDIHIRGVSVWRLPGYTSTILAVLFLGGVQLICIGILGEYIGRIYDEVKQRPAYLVRKTVGFGARAGKEPSSHRGQGPVL
ncbi:MAG: glycosyltransferase family 2 protein [Gemmataceae bacterium]